MYDCLIIGRRRVVFMMPENNKIMNYELVVVADSNSVGLVVREVRPALRTARHRPPTGIMWRCFCFAAETAIAALGCCLLMCLC